VPITDTQSYSSVIRDVLFARCVTLPFFEGFTARRCKQLPTQEYHLPYLGVYIVDENMTADGDWNAGEIRFIHDLKIGFSVQFEDNDPLKLELKLDAAFWAIMSLWEDQYLMNFLHTWNPHSQTEHPDNTRMEGIPRGRRDHNWGMNAETPFAELQYEPVIRYRTRWPPWIDDDLLLVHSENVPMIGPLGGRHAPDEDEVRRIIMKYEFQPSP
jgi:hypothetical protein